MANTHRDEGTDRAASRDAVIAATQLSLVRVALAFGLTNAAVPFLVLALGSGTRLEFVLALGWVLGWTLAVVQARRLMSLLERTASRLTLVTLTGLASVATIVATDGLDSPLKTGGNWLGWAATVVVPPGQALVVAGMFSTSIMAAFLLSGSTLPDLLTGDDRYVVITGMLNPFVVVLVALALAGVFRAVIAGAPGWLWSIRGGGHATSPGLTALFQGEPIALLTGAPPPTADEAAVDAAAVGETSSSRSLAEDELTIVDLLAAGRAPKQIARDLGRSTAYVYERIASAKAKTSASTIEQLVVVAWRPQP